MTMAQLLALATAFCVGGWVAYSVAAWAVAIVLFLLSLLASFLVAASVGAR